MYWSAPVQKQVLLQRKGTRKDKPSHSVSVGADKDIKSNEVGKEKILEEIYADLDDFDDEIDDKDDDDKIFDEIMRDMQTDIEDGDLKSGQVHAYTTDNNDDIFDYEI